MLNLSLTLKAMGEGERAHAAALQSIDALNASSSGMELASARFALAAAIAWQGDLGRARDVFKEEALHLKHAMQAELHLEVADLEAELGDALTAQGAMKSLDADDPPETFRYMAASAKSLLLIRSGRARDAWPLLDPQLASRPAPEPGRLSRIMAIRSYAALMLGLPEASRLAYDAERFAERQGAGRHQRMAALVLAASENQLDAEIASLPTAAHRSCRSSPSLSRCISQDWVLKPWASLPKRPPSDGNAGCRVSDRLRPSKPAPQDDLLQQGFSTSSENSRTSLGCDGSHENPAGRRAIEAWAEPLLEG